MENEKEISLEKEVILRNIRYFIENLKKQNIGIIIYDVTNINPPMFICDSFDYYLDKLLQLDTRLLKVILNVSKLDDNSEELKTFSFKHYIIAKGYSEYIENKIIQDISPPIITEKYLKDYCTAHKEVLKLLKNVFIKYDFVEYGIIHKVNNQYCKTKDNIVVYNCTNLVYINSLNIISLIQLKSDIEDFKIILDSVNSKSKDNFLSTFENRYIYAYNKPDW